MISCLKNFCIEFHRFQQLRSMKEMKYSAIIEVSSTYPKLIGAFCSCSNTC